MPHIVWFCVEAHTLIVLMLLAVCAFSKNAIKNDISIRKCNNGNFVIVDWLGLARCDGVVFSISQFVSIELLNFFFLFLFSVNSFTTKLIPRYGDFLMLHLSEQNVVLI